MLFYPTTPAPRASQGQPKPKANDMSVESHSLGYILTNVPSYFGQSVGCSRCTTLQTLVIIL